MSGTVSANNIDALSGVTFPATDFTGVSFQSWTGNITPAIPSAANPAGAGDSTLSTVTVTTTGAISDLVIPSTSAKADPGETLTPFGITDNNNPAGNRTRGCPGGC
jgi:hypothetical protein